VGVPCTVICKYIERCEFASAGAEHLRGKENSFTSKIDGDNWSSSGILDTGFKVEETWERQK